MSFGLFAGHCYIVNNHHTKLLTTLLFLFRFFFSFLSVSTHFSAFSVFVSAAQKSGFLLFFTCFTGTGFTFI